MENDGKSQGLSFGNSKENKAHCSKEMEIPDKSRRSRQYKAQSSYDEEHISHHKGQMEFKREKEYVNSQSIESPDEERY